MITYDYVCGTCGFTEVRLVEYSERHNQWCVRCGKAAHMQMPAPLGRIAGRAVSGGGPDRFTADMLGIPLKELPPGLKA